MAIPESIKQKAKKIRNEVYGRDVREALASGIEEAGDIADQASTKSNDAVEQVDNIQAQVNQLVIDGDSSVEAAQARVDEKGQTHATLKDRIDDGFIKVNSQLAQTVTHDDLSVIGVNIMKPPAPLTGAVGDGVTDDSSTIQAILDNYTNIIVPENHTFFIGKSITYYNKSHLTISGGGTLKPRKDIKMFDLSNVENIEIHNITLDGSNQKNNAHSDNYLIHGDNLKNVHIHNVVLLNGAMGVVIDNVEDYTLENCFATGFSGWAIRSGGNVCNVNWSNNISHSNGYDGLKMTGQLQNVVVTENVCYNNTRDGFDFAGHSVENLKVFNNNFYQNGVEGVEIKPLDRSTNPLPVDLIPTFNAVEIYGNTLTNNGSFGIQINNKYSREMLTKGVLIQDNHIFDKDGSTTSASAMRIVLDVVEKGDVVVMRNTVDGDFDRGIRIIDCKNVVVKDNYVKVRNRSIEIENQQGVSEFNEVHDNTLISRDYRCVNLLQGTRNYLIHNNKWETHADNHYRVFNSGDDTNRIYNNQVTNIQTSETPSGRGTKGEIVYSVDV